MRLQRLVGGWGYSEDSTVFSVNIEIKEELQVMLPSCSSIYCRGKLNLPLGYSSYMKWQQVNIIILLKEKVKNVEGHFLVFSVV